MRGAALGLLAALCFVASGCDRLFYARLSTESTPEQPVFLFGDRADASGEAWVYGLRVDGRPRRLVPGDTLNPWHTFWQVEKDDGWRYVAVDTVRYGVVPAHCHGVIGPESLPAGRLYVCAGQFHGLGHAVYFEIAADSSGNKTIRELTEDEFLAIIGDTL